MSTRLNCAATALAGLLLANVALAQNPEPATKASAVRRFLAAEYTQSAFFADNAPWQFLALSASRRGPHGTFIARANLASRFEINGAQVELDAYPRFGEHFYGYANVGYSNDLIFPHWRSGAEVFASLPSAFEASLGYRQLQFVGHTTTLYTASAGKYSGNWWFSVRPYFVKRTLDTDLSSVVLTGRRYGEDADHFVGFLLSVGVSPSERADQSQIGSSGSASAMISGSRDLSPSVLGSWAVGWEGRRAFTNQVQSRVDLSVGFKRRF